MSLAQKVAEMHRLKTTDEGAMEFARLAHFILRHRGSDRNAIANALHMTPQRDREDRKRVEA